ncbi:MAG: AraC family transcriptional regulator [Butyricicoccus sp.]|nr:AraC family transcriptional regulator [Butyricicoccus sp.]
MYRVLLADDDMIVHMFLKDAFDWATYGFSVAGDARDGEEALQLFRQIRPALVLTDISMPRINGIELIRKLRQEEGFEGAIIALSCYDDRALVQQAIQNGADEYLLKNHLSEQTMGAVMQKIHDRVAARPCVSDTVSPAQQIHQTYEIARRDWMEYILSGGNDPAVLTEKLHGAGLDSKYRRAAALLIAPLHADEGQTNALHELASRRVLDERCIFLHTSHNGFALLADFSGNPSTSDALAALHTWQAQIADLAMQYLNLTVNFFISSICEGEQAVVHAFRQAHAMLPYGFYGAGHWQYGTQAPLSDGCPPEAEQFIRDLPALLQSIEQLPAAYEAALQAFAHHKVQPGILLDWLRRCDYAAGIVRSEKEYSMLRHFSDYTSLEQAYLPQAALDLPASAGPAVRAAARYVQEHYAEPIGLGHAARHVNLSSAYLSTLFKQEMGISFSKYLIRIRIVQIQQRLLHSTLTIKQISEDAGFHDYQYFCKAFKRETGVSPTEFRQKYQSR